MVWCPGGLFFEYGGAFCKFGLDKPFVCVLEYGGGAPGLLLTPGTFHPIGFFSSYRGALGSGFFCVEVALDADDDELEPLPVIFDHQLPPEDDDDDEDPRPVDPRPEDDPRPDDDRLFIASHCVTINEKITITAPNDINLCDNFIVHYTNHSTEMILVDFQFCLLFFRDFSHVFWSVFHSMSNDISENTN